MAISSANAAAAPKTRKVETLTSGTDWTVPANVTYVNATLIGGGGGGGGGTGSGGYESGAGSGGQIITTEVATTPGASISYGIGAGGTGGAVGSKGGDGGTTTFTDATSALGGSGGYTASTDSVGAAGKNGLISPNFGSGSHQNVAGAAGGAGQIILEYWV
jgi:hypothetical protein